MILFGEHAEFEVFVSRCRVCYLPYLPNFLANSGLLFCKRTRFKELNIKVFETIYHGALEASNELAVKDGTYET
jgi:hypothetical protein